jgi:multidrug efflux pump subunit AcrB
MPAGTREHITDYWLDHIEEAARAVNEDYKAQREDSLDVIVDIQKKIGPTSYQGSLNIILLDSERRNSPSFEIQEAIRKKTGNIYEAENLSYGSAQAFGKPISISLLGRNSEELTNAKNALKEAMLDFSSLRDVVDNDREGVREVIIKLKDKARLLGFTIQDVMGQVRNGFFGYEAQRIQRGRDEVKVWVRLKESDRSSVFNLEEFMISAPDGSAYPLREIADYSIERGVININHLDGQREVKIEADLSNPDESAPAILDEIRTNVLPDILDKYPSVVPLYEGQNREAQKTSKSATQVLTIVLFLIILVITFTFRSIFQTITIVLMIPLSFAGVAWGHYIHGMPMSILSFLGMVALIGIIVNDSLVLVTKFNSYIKDGMAFGDAIYRAGVSRFRAIFLTTVTTVAGLAPLIFEKSFQAQFLKPMAVSIAYGILYATFLTLIMLPVVLSYVNDILVGKSWLWTGQKPEREDVEPAKKELIDEEEMAAADHTSF